MAPKSDGRTRSDRLAAAIADAIVSAELPPGTRLDEQGLADRYEVSRTPVREALRQLATSGLIEMRPHRGAVVAAVTRERLEALFVAMGEMEATCARLCALCMTPLERRRLQALQEAMADLVHQGDPAPYEQANVVFHSAIYAGAHNAVLQEMTAGLRRRLAPFRRAQFRTAGRLARSFAEHAEVVRAIVAGDAAAAHRTMLHHVSLVGDAFEEFAVSRGVALEPLPSSYA
jgi:DNA-binding GntR family transcriptional regulator